jgi:hypothetical protein
MSSRGGERRQRRKRPWFLGSIERLFRESCASAAGTGLKDLESDSCVLEASRPRLRRETSGRIVWMRLCPGALRSARFWFALMLIPDWAGHSAMAQETQQPQQLLPYAPMNTAPPVGNPPSYKEPPSYKTPPAYKVAPGYPERPSLGGPLAYGEPPGYGGTPSIRPGGNVAPAGQPKFEPPDLPVLVRPRPESDPLGVRLGSVLVFPDLRISEFYDDNILFSESHTQDDFITEIAPRLAIQSDWEEDFLGLEAYGAIGRYAQHTNQNYEDYGTSLQGLFWTTDTSYIYHRFSYDRRHANRDVPEDAAGVHPTEYDDLSNNLGFFQQFGRFTLRLDGNFRRFDYLNDKQIVAGVVTPIDNSDRDRNEFTGNARVGYLIRPDIEAYVQGGYGAIHYDTSPDDNGFERNADRYDAVVGIAKSWNGIFESDVYVGYLAQTIEDSRLNTIDGVDFGGKLAWNVTRRTTFTVLAGRSIKVTTLADSSGALVTEAGFNIDHELLRDLLLYLNTRWRQSDYSGIDRTDDTYEVGVGANYFIMRNFVVGAGYNYRQRNSTVANNDYERNLIMLNLDLRF